MSPESPLVTHHSTLASTIMPHLKKPWMPATTGPHKGHHLLLLPSLSPMMARAPLRDVEVSPASTRYWLPPFRVFFKTRHVRGGRGNDEEQWISIEQVVQFSFRIKIYQISCLRHEGDFSPQIIRGRRPRKRARESLQWNSSRSLQERRGGGRGGGGKGGPTFYVVAHVRPASIFSLFHSCLPHSIHLMPHLCREHPYHWTMSQPRFR